MQHLIVCCDGTWNSQDQDSVTNVRRLYNALADRDDTPESNRQRAYYVPGVGTAGGVVSRLLGGGFGVGAVGVEAGRGLDDTVQDGYSWLLSTYQPGDRIELFGFSRGAYTARSLAGLIARCGLFETEAMGEEQAWRRIKRAYQHYRYGAESDRNWREGLRFRFDPADADMIPVDFIGVWDTVGSLGLPDYLRWILPVWRYEFHDVKINPHVAHARHAVAMDEFRGPFRPTLWESEPGQDVRQVWFPGSHMDVGGGHRETGLSDRALQWMIDEASRTVRLGFAKKTWEEQIHPDPLDVLHDDDRSALGWLYPVLADKIEPFLALRPRAVPVVDPAHRVPEIDSSVYQRQETPSITGGRYRCTRILAPGESATVDVFAREPWNETGLYLEPGRYTMTASGEWVDLDIASGPGGTTGPLSWLRPREAVRNVSTVIGWLETAYRCATGDGRAYFPGARREPDLPWMSLVGYVANDAVQVGGQPSEHERIPIGRQVSHAVTRGGYLYVFANDAWGFYGNNRGSLRLTVERHGAGSSSRRSQGKRPAKSSSRR